MTNKSGMQSISESYRSFTNSSCEKVQAYKQISFLFGRYDIPVLHLDDVYWAKHRLTAEEAISAMEQAKQGTFQESQGEPDAGRLERS